LACAFTCCPPGKPGFTGGEDLLGWNILAQIARYHDVWVLTNAEDQASVEEGLRESGLESINFHYIGLPSWMKPFLRFQGAHQFYYLIWQIVAWFAARRLHREIGFDLFHHVTYANDWMGSFIGAYIAIPYVRGPGGGGHRTPKGFESEYPIGGRIWEKVRSFSQWLFRHEPVFVRGQSRARAILVCNNEAELVASKKWGSKTKLFPVSGISSEDLATRQQSQTDGKFRVITAGSLIRVKGFGLAIKGFREFAREHPEANLAIIGDGPELPRLTNIVKHSGISNQIHFLGELPRDQLLGEMGGSDVFLFPSLRDGGGTVVVEAMGLGKPVICLDAGGPGMHITQECGVKITPQSPQQVVDDIAIALEDLYQNTDLREQLGRSARKRAEELYHWDRLGDRLRNIYDRALDLDDTARED
tara:strand:- start:1577 stop:2827 length:1251 start_codon:yes stop_codon:yes gene_type:complete